MFYNSHDTGLSCLSPDFGRDPSSDIIFHLQSGKYPQSCLCTVGNTVDKQVLLYFSKLVPFGRIF